MSGFWNRVGVEQSAAAKASSSAPLPGDGRTNRFASILHNSALPAGGIKGSIGNVSQGAPSRSAAAASTAAQDSSSASSDTGASITANDFLTLLVTEMQNQDPTADVDPNEYIDQLVQVNSLEQLISINQNLETVLGAASTQSPSTQASSVQGRGAAVTAHGAGTTASTKTLDHFGGNLSAPHGSKASRTVASSLGGEARPGAGRHAIRDIPTKALPR